MALSKTVARAVQYLGQVRNYSADTIASYQTSFDQFRHFLQSRGFADEMRHFTDDNCREFAQYLADQGMKPNSIVTRLSGLSALAMTLMKMKDTRGKPYLANNPTKLFDWPQAEDTETAFLLPDELERFLAVKRSPDESLARDIFVDTGMRASELANANVEDVVEIGGRVAIAVSRKGRGRKHRKDHAPLSETVAASVIDTLVKRGIPNAQTSEHRGKPLIVNHFGRRYSRSALSQLMCRIGLEAGITRFRVSSHKLRHTANVVSRFAGNDALVRSRLLGQTNQKSQERYDHIIPSELFEARERQAEGLRKYLGRDNVTPH